MPHGPSLVREMPQLALRHRPVLHANAINNLQYGFPYDDDAGQSSDISVTNPQYLAVAVGW